MQHFTEFVSFKDFEYAFMQNLLGNILSFMDIYEKSSAAAENEDYITVVQQLGRALRRTLIFPSMLKASQDSEDDLAPVYQPSEPLKLEKPLLHMVVGDEMGTS